MKIRLECKLLVGALASFLTSFPAPGRKVLTLMIFPGAGKGDSIRLLMKG